MHRNLKLNTMADLVEVLEACECFVHKQVGETHLSGQYAKSTYLHYLADKVCQAKLSAKGAEKGCVHE